MTNPISFEFSLSVCMAEGFLFLPKVADKFLSLESFGNFGSIFARSKEPEQAHLPMSIGLLLHEQVSGADARRAGPDSHLASRPF